MNKNKSEILAPAGSMESLVAAIRCGANAVYLGSKAFSARANATNFDNEELKQAVEYAHKCGAKIYQTINTLIFDSQFEEIKKVIEFSVSIGVDAFIVQDLGVCQYIKQIAPQMPLHASTQMTIHTKQGALLAKELGFCRVVVARELSKRQIEEIVSTGIEVEAFVHGALCMSVSGQCYMSAMIGSRSANRGLCAQACRLPFSAIDGQTRCDLSLKDMSYVDFISEMNEIGVASLKIEGRMKRPEYVAAATTACVQALDGQIPDTETLRAVFARSGFTDGYYTDNKGNDMFGIRKKEDVVSAEKVLPSLRELYKKEVKITQVDFNIEIKDGKQTVLTALDGDGNKVVALGDIPAKAINRPTDIETVKKQLSKLGDTIYTLGNIEAQIDDGLIVPASILNDLRRRICEALDEQRIKTNTNIFNIESFDFKPIKTQNIEKREIRIEVTKASQIENVSLDDVEKVIIPVDEWKKVIDIKDKVILSLPRFTNFEEDTIEELKLAKENGFNAIECTNLAHIKVGTDLNLEMHGGFGLNITNSLSLKAISELGLKDTSVSFELKLSQIERLSDFMPFGIIAYGYLPLMLTVNCPVKQAVGCNNCTKHLTDRTDRVFPVKCGDDAVEILNCDVLYMADRLDEIKGVSFITLKFNDKSPRKVGDIINQYKNGSKPFSKDFTRGLYYRGII